MYQNRFQLAAVALSALSAFAAPFFAGIQLDSTDALVRPVAQRQPSAPPAPQEETASVPALGKPFESAAPSASSGAGFNYSDPLENRVAQLEYWSKGAEERVAQIERDHAEWKNVHNRQQEILDRLAGTLSDMRSASPAAKASQASPSASGQVSSSTVVSGSSAFQASPDGVLSVRQGASSVEVAAALAAMGYRTSYAGPQVQPVTYSAYGSSPVSYGSNGGSYAGSYGSAGVSYGASYGSAGNSAMVASYGSAGAAPVAASYYGSIPTSFGSPVYQTSEYVVPYASSQAVQYMSSAAVAEPARRGLFGRRAARSGSYGTYSAGGTCRMVNGQMICN